MMKGKLTRGSLLLLALFPTVGLNALAGNTWYVDGVRGNDANDCTSTATACKTIAHGISHTAMDDSIIVAPGTYTENLSIAVNLTIVGSGARTTIVDGGGSAAVVTINNVAAHVALSGLTVRNGLGLSYGGAGIHNLGILTITNTTVTGNSSNDSVTAAAGLGGGIYNAGTLTVIQSTISGNSVTRYRMSASRLAAVSITLAG